MQIQKTENKNSSVRIKENINGDSNTIKLFYNSICKRIIRGYEKCAQ